MSNHYDSYYFKNSDFVNVLNNLLKYLLMKISLKFLTKQMPIEPGPLLTRARSYAPYVGHMWGSEYKLAIISKRVEDRCSNSPNNNSKIEYYKN